MQNRIPAFLPGKAAVRNFFVSGPVDPLHHAEHQPEPVSTVAFIEGMRGAVTGVNIVTTDGAAGRFGVTVSAFSSVSAEPPTVLVCINRTSPLCDALTINECFAINVLSTFQQSLAGTFAGSPDSGAPYDFSAARWNPSTTGAPVLSGAVAGFDCALVTLVDVGTHRIFIGRVVGVATAARDPLLYSNRKYGRVGR